MPASVSGAGTIKVPDAILKIKDAFDVFESQSTLLQLSYENLKRDLEDSNQALNRKNRALSTKVHELRQMSSRLECILESQADGVLVVNDALQVERCNPVAARLLGVPKDRIEGFGYDALANSLGNLDVLKSVIHEGKSCLDEQRCSVSDDGENTIVLASVAPIRSPNGAILGAVEVWRDVTEFRDLEDRVHCRERMAALGEMAATVAHEIRNPLGTIEGFARLLKRDLADTPEHCRLASRIVEGAQNLNYVITNLLTYARPMSLQCEAFDSVRLLSDVQDVLSAAALREKVRVVVSRPKEPTTVHGDIRQLRQVLLNLGLNSIDACSEGGVVAISSYRKGSRFIFRVQDNGIGIQKADMRRIFDPFFTRKHGGTGLGLSLCHKIVSAHGGEITVSSEVDKGTCFEVLVPGQKHLRADSGAVLSKNLEEQKRTEKVIS